VPYAEERTHPHACATICARTYFLACGHAFTRTPASRKSGIFPHLYPASSARTLCVRVCVRGACVCVYAYCVDSQFVIDWSTCALVVMTRRQTLMRRRGNKHSKTIGGSKRRRGRRKRAPNGGRWTNTRKTWKKRRRKLKRQRAKLPLPMLR
jgi:hypothetical protein